MCSCEYSVESFNLFGDTSTVWSSLWQRKCVAMVLFRISIRIFVCGGFFCSDIYLASVSCYHWLSPCILSSLQCRKKKLNAIATAHFGPQIIHWSVSERHMFGCLVLVFLLAFRQHTDLDCCFDVLTPVVTFFQQVFEISPHLPPVLEAHFP